MRAHHVVGLTLLVMLAGCVVEPPPAPLLPLPVSTTPLSASYVTQAPAAAAQTRTPANQRVTTAAPVAVYPGYAVYPAYPFYGPYPFYAGYYPYPFFPGYLGFGYRFP